jgi:sec-independent protein translocase protein TatA
MQQPVMFALIGPIGIWELVIILLILMLIFGANRLSGLGKGMGQAIRGFKDEMTPDKDKDDA